MTLETVKSIEEASLPNKSRAPEPSRKRKRRSPLTFLRDQRAMNWVALQMLMGDRAKYLALIFTIAAVKAVLVLRNYMHLKHEHYLIYIIVAVPALFLLGFAISLIPDIVFRHGG